MQIVDKISHTKGKIYRIKPEEDTIIEILFLFHAIERINKWELKEEVLLETLLYPEEVLIGHRGRYIAHKRYGEHIVRAVYEYDGDLPILLTVYFPYKTRYFKGGGVYEDKIFKGC